jgi:hypothetical protein
VKDGETADLRPALRNAYLPYSVRNPLFMYPHFTYDAPRQLNFATKPALPNGQHRRIVILFGPFHGATQAFGLRKALAFGSELSKKRLPP